MPRGVAAGGSLVPRGLFSYGERLYSYLWAASNQKLDGFVLGTSEGFLDNK